MNWRLNANLFAKGKFSCISNGEKYMICGFSYHPALDRDRFDCLHESQGSTSRPIHVDDCQLIARKIESMTDEELMTFHNEAYSPFEKMDKIDLINAVKKVKDFESVMWLLSIGILPPIFSDEDVIWEDS